MINKLKKARAPMWWGRAMESLPKFSLPFLEPKEWTPELARRWVDAVGSYAFLVIDNQQDTNPGQTRSGSNLYYTNANANSSTSYPVGSGTWRCMGQVRGGTTRGEGYATVWLRIS